MRIVNRLGIATAGILALTVIGTPVFAVAAANPHANAEAQSAAQSADETGQTNPNKPADPDSQGTTKSAAAKLKSCQNREKAINNIMTRIAGRGQKQLDLFTSIATKTEKFYTDKGKTLSNYDALVADVNAKQTAAQTAVDAVKADSVTFKCDGTDPKGAASSFKAALKSEISALKDYKTAVKNLIVRVKSVQGTTTSADQTTGGTQ